MMRDTGTSSAQTAGCGSHRNPARVVQDFRLQSCWSTQQGCWLQCTAGSEVLPVQESLPVPECTSFRFSADSIHLHRELPVPECCQFRSVPASYPVLRTDSPVQKITGSGVLPVPESTSLTCTQNYRSRSASGSGVFAGSGVYQLDLYRELPVPECCRFRSVPTSNPVLTTDSPVQRITSSGVLPVPECCLFRSVPASKPVLTTDPPVTEIYRFRSVTVPEPCRLQ